MATKITVNGVTYDSVDAMPPEARRLYDEMLAKLPDLTDRDGDGIPDIVESGALPIAPGATVRKTFIVNGTTYGDLASMPSDVRQAYELGMRTMASGDPEVTKREFRVSFQVTPGFSIRKGSPLGSALRLMMHTPGADRAPQPLLGNTDAKPIEPGSSAGGLRAVLILAACVAGVLLLWFLTRGH